MESLGSISSDHVPQTPRAVVKEGKLYIDDKEYKVDHKGKSLPYQERVMEEAAKVINATSGFNPKEGVKALGQDLTLTAVESKVTKTAQRVMRDRPKGMRLKESPFTTPPSDTPPPLPPLPRPVAPPRKPKG